MNTFLLTWNPDKWYGPEFVDHAIKATAHGKVSADNWSVGNRRYGLTPGDRALLVRQHRDRGIVASGTFTSEIYEYDHWNSEPDQTALYADVDFDTWLPAEDALNIDVLKRNVPEVTWDHLQAGGVLLSEAVADRLENLWVNHLGAVGRSAPATTAGNRRAKTDSHPNKQLLEGDEKLVVLTKYERNAKARRACIEKWGNRCVVCGFDFETRYGDLGKGYIMVHHLVDLAMCGGKYVVDPVKDLRPVCPNCHAMLHRAGRPAMEIKKLRALLRPA